MRLSHVTNNLQFSDSLSHSIAFNERFTQGTCCLQSTPCCALLHVWLWLVPSTSLATHTKKRAKIPINPIEQKKNFGLEVSGKNLYSIQSVCYIFIYWKIWFLTPQMNRMIRWKNDSFHRNWSSSTARTSYRLYSSSPCQTAKTLEGLRGESDYCELAY